MKKQMLNLGKALNKIEQKSINGGGGDLGSRCKAQTCPPGLYCHFYLSGIGFCEEFPVEV